MKTFVQLLFATLAPLLSLSSPLAAASDANPKVSPNPSGRLPGPAVITRLSATVLPRSGYLEILGRNFGTDGKVVIGGIGALVAEWSDHRIVAYVPEGAPVGTLPLQVFSSRGDSNTIMLGVTLRPAAANRVNWRFRMDGPYSEVRPVVASDQTIYAVDAFQHLYALTPDGGLKWLARGAGDKGIAIGLDGTIYVASETFITAFNPDGSLRWEFLQKPRAFICLGVSVGPDGNVYSVATEGPGVFSLAPTGTMRWQLPESYDRPIVDFGEIVMGPNGANQQLYFAANNHLRAVRLDGSPVFTLAGSFGQPAIAPDGSVHTSISAFSPFGSLLWTFASPYPYNVLTPPDVGSNGIHYFVQNLRELFALNANGSQRWHRTLTSFVNGPIVDPLNVQLVMGSADTLDHAGFILSTSTVDGHELWRVVLPAEDPNVFNPGTGLLGFNQFVSTRARFNSDGKTVYVMTATATGDNQTSRSFLYSLDAGVASPSTTAASLRSVSITLTPHPLRSLGVHCQVAVEDHRGEPMPGATVSFSWKLPGGVTTNEIASTGPKGRATFDTNAGPGSYTATVTDITMTGFKFDAANSVRSESITIK